MFPLANIPFFNNSILQPLRIFLSHNLNKYAREVTFLQKVEPSIHSNHWYPHLKVFLPLSGLLITSTLIAE